MTVLLKKLIGISLILIGSYNVVKRILPFKSG